MYGFEEFRIFKCLGTSIMERRAICEEIKVRIVVCSHDVMVYSIFQSLEP
jgi:hypothetical protein